MSDISEFKIVTSTIYVFQVFTMLSGIFCLWEYWSNWQMIELLTGVLLIFFSYRAFKLGQFYRESVAQRVLDLIKNDPYQRLNRRNRRKLERLTKNR